MNGFIETKIATNLKKYRKMNELTQSDIAGLLGVHVNTYSSYETGRALPSLNILAKMAYIMHFSIDELLELPSKEKGVNEKIAQVEVLKALRAQIDNEIKLLNTNDLDSGFALANSVISKDWEDFINMEYSC